MTDLENFLQNGGKLAEIDLEFGLAKEEGYHPLLRMKNRT
jgi:hypothetical protein